MTPHTILVALAASLGLVVLRFSLIAGRHALRGRRERRPSRQREVIAEILEFGGPSELGRLARRARRSWALRVDLGRAARTTLPGLHAGRTALLHEAAMASGLTAQSRRGLCSRDAIRRGQAIVVGTHVCGFAAADLEPLLADGDGDVRLAAADALMHIGDTASARALVRALRHDQVPAERLVGRLRGAAAADVLVDACTLPGYAAVRPDLIEALGAIGDVRAEELLRSFLRDGVDEERVRAARALGAIGGVGAVPQLEHALADDFWPVRAQAARALGALGGMAAVAVDALAARLGDPSWWVRANCAEALRAVGGPGLDILRECADRHPDHYARERAAEALETDAAARGAMAATLENFVYRQTPQLPPRKVTAS